MKVLILMIKYVIKKFTLDQCAKNAIFNTEVKYLFIQKMMMVNVNLAEITQNFLFLLN